MGTIVIFVAAFPTLRGDPDPTDASDGRWGFFRREKPRPVAVVWKSRGTVGPGSLGAGKSLPLDVLERRL